MKRFCCGILLLSCSLLFLSEAYGADQKKVLRINDKVLKVEWSVSDVDRIQGLQGRSSLAEDEGMIFDYGEERRLSFWMKNTSIPLSIAFIDRNGVILEIQDMEPNSLVSHRSAQKARYALEVNQGWFDHNQIKVGDVVHFPES